MTERETVSSLEIRRRGHITDVLLPTGSITIVYGSHRRLTTFNDIPPHTDGIFLENWSALNMNAQGVTSVLLKDRQYAEVAKGARDKTIPLYLADLRLAGKLGDIIFYGGSLSKLLGFPTLAILFGIGADSLEEVALKAGPFLYDALAYWNLLLAGNLLTADTQARIARLTIRSHPHIMPLSLHSRNSIWAHKLSWILEQNQGKHFTTIVGATHVGLETALRKISKGKKTRALDLTRRILLKVGVPESIYSIARFVPNGETGLFELDRVYEVPELKELVEGKAA